MTIAFDAETSSESTQATDITISHTPVGTPKGVLVLISQGDTGDDTITGVTYGGTAMTEMSNSPSIGVGEASALYAYFLGSNVPTGAQDAVISPNASRLRLCSVITLTGAADLEENVTEVLINSNNTNVHTATFALGSVESFVAEVWGHGRLGIGDMAPLSGWTDRGWLDKGTEVGGIYSYDTIGTADVTAGMDYTGYEDNHTFAVAINEGEASTEPTITDINTDEILLDGEQNATYEVTDFSSSITTIKLVSGTAETDCSGVTED